jgi:hypothetical protein
VHLNGCFSAEGWQGTQQDSPESGIGIFTWTINLFKLILELFVSLVLPMKLFINEATNYSLLSVCQPRCFIFRFIYATKCPISSNQPVVFSSGLSIADTSCLLVAGLTEQKMDTILLS